MRAGKLDQRVTFQVLTATRDATGGQTETWADSFTEWGEAITSGGKEYYAAQKVNAETTVVFRVRYKSVLDTSAASASYRVKWKTRTFNILNINVVSGNRREMLVSCKEVV